MTWDLNPVCLYAVQLMGDLVSAGVLSFSSKTFHCGSGCSLAAVQLDLGPKKVDLMTNSL